MAVDPPKIKLRGSVNRRNQLGRLGFWHAKLLILVACRKIAVGCRVHTAVNPQDHGCAPANL